MNARRIARRAIGAASCVAIAGVVAAGAGYLAAAKVVDILRNAPEQDA